MNAEEAIAILAARGIKVDINKEYSLLKFLVYKKRIVCSLEYMYRHTNKEELVESILMYVKDIDRVI